MPSAHELAAQLTACRAYLANSLGHIPEVRKLIRGIDNTLQAEDTPGLHGVSYSPAGMPMVEVVIRGDKAVVSTRVPPDGHRAGRLVAQLNAGITIPLTQIPATPAGMPST